MEFEKELNPIEGQLPCFLMWLLIFSVGEVEDNELFRCHDLILVKATPEHF